MRNVLPLVLTLGLASVAAAGPADVGVRIRIDTAAQLQAVERESTSIWNCRYGVGGELEASFSPDALGRLDELGIAYDVIMPDVRAAIEAERAEIEARRLLRDADWFDNYHTLTEIEAYIAQLGADFPAIVSTRVIGSSIEGRDIVAFDVTGPDTPADAPVIIFNGGQHAREWINPATVMYIADHMIRGYDSDPRIASLLNNIRFIFVPVVNPDGYEYTWSTYRLWRKNRRDNGDGTWGVDPNRNWSWRFGWPGSSGDGASEIYRGSEPFSEPETRALRDLALSEPTLVAHVDWHSYSQLLLYPFGGVQDIPAEPYRTFFRELGDDMADEILAVHGKAYTPQPGYQLYLAAGICSDWFFTEVGAASWTFELRPNGSPGFEAPPDQIRPCGEEMLPAALLLAERSAMPLLVDFPDGFSETVAPDAPAQIAVRIFDGLESLLPGSVRVRVGLGGGSFSNVEASPDAEGRFIVNLPPTTCGQVIEFSIEAETTSGRSVVIPGPNAPFAIQSIETVELFDDDAEADLGWTYGAAGDTATAGIWERGDPESTPLQPEDDTSANGTMCFVTGAPAGLHYNDFDVDGGYTSLISPRIDLSALPVGVTPVLSYQRWVYMGIPDGNTSDWFLVSISDDDGQTWTVIEDPAVKKGGWRRIEVPVLDHVGATDSIRIMFQAADTGFDTPVEMAVDDVTLTYFICTTCGRADITTQGTADGDPGYGLPDGFITGSDISFYVNLWVPGDPAADLTGLVQVGEPGYGIPDGVVSAADINFFVNLWVSGCP